jgi:hypothetical protein
MLQNLQQPKSEFTVLFRRRRCHLSQAVDFFGVLLVYHEF